MGSLPWLSTSSVCQAASAPPVLQEVLSPAETQGIITQGITKILSFLTSKSKTEFILKPMLSPKAFVKTWTLKRHSFIQEAEKETWRFKNPAYNTKENWLAIFWFYTNKEFSIAHNSDLISLLVHSIQGTSQESHPKMWYPKWVSI